MMTLTETDIAAIREGWARVAEDPEGAAAAFYARLFETTPRLRVVFAGTDMAAQGVKLATALDVVVGMLHAPDALLPDLRALGRRHAGYRARGEDYDAVGAALIWTLAQALGDRFTPEARAAWTTAYALVAGAMQAASAEPA